MSLLTGYNSPKARNFYKYMVTSNFVLELKRIQYIYIYILTYFLFFIGFMTTLCVRNRPSAGEIIVLGGKHEINITQLTVRAA